MKTEIVLAKLVQGRRPIKDGYGPWCTLNTLSGEDPDKLQKEAEKRLAEWNSHGTDGRGTFSNWQFRVIDKVAI